MKPRKWEDTFGNNEKPVYDRPKTTFWTWIENTFEPEAFVNWCLAVYFILVLFYIIYTA